MTIDHDDETHDWESCQECIDQAIEDGILSPDAKPLPVG